MIRIIVHGTPAQEGSYNPIHFRRKDNSRGTYMKPADKNLKAWKQAIGYAARSVAPDKPISKNTPLTVAITVFLPYFTNGRGAEMSMQEMLALGIYPIAYHDGDIDKHIRAILDALKGIIYEDDRQVCAVPPAQGFTMNKLYACTDYPTGAIIEVSYI